MHSFKWHPIQWTRICLAVKVEHELIENAEQLFLKHLKWVTEIGEWVQKEI
jgi:hypothetical protein